MRTGALRWKHGRAQLASAVMPSSGDSWSRLHALSYILALSLPWTLQLDLPQVGVLTLPESDVTITGSPQSSK